MHVAVVAQARIHSAVTVGDSVGQSSEMGHCSGPSGLNEAAKGWLFGVMHWHWKCLECSEVKGAF